MSAVISTEKQKKKTGRGSHPNSRANLRPAPPFKPGQSGNPGGQQKGAVYVAEAYKRLLTLEPDELDTYKPKTIAEKIALTQIMTAISIDDDSLPAAKEITDRTEGKSEQKKSVTENRTITVIFERPQFQNYADQHTDATPGTGEDTEGVPALQHPRLRTPLRQIVAGEIPVD